MDSSPKVPSFKIFYSPIKRNDITDEHLGLLSTYLITGLEESNLTNLFGLEINWFG